MALRHEWKHRIDTAGLLELRARTAGSAARLTVGIFEADDAVTGCLTAYAREHPEVEFELHCSIETEENLDINRYDMLLYPDDSRYGKFRGVPLREENVAAMRESGTVVLLTASPEVILERVRDSDERPLLQGHKDVPYIAALMEQRRPRYEAAADITVDTSRLNIEEVCRQVLRQVPSDNEL